MHHPYAFERPEQTTVPVVPNISFAFLGRNESFQSNLVVDYRVESASP
jgi:hypothetical protein